MSALTTIFNYLYVYLRVFIAYIFGGTLHTHQFKGDFREPFIVILNSVGITDSLQYDRAVITFELQPILILIVGIFVVGSIIGLVRRLIR